MTTSIFLTRLLVMILLTGIMREYVFALYKKPIKIFGKSITLLEIGTELMIVLAIVVCNYEPK